MIDQTGFSHIDNADRNRRVILNIVRDRAPLTRREVASVCSLSMSTTKRLLEALLQEGIVRECRTELGAGRPGRRGRKAQALCLTPGFAHAIGVNVEPGLIELCAVDLEGSVLAERQVDMPDNRREAVTAQAMGAVRELREEMAGRGRLLGVGVGIAGVINAREGLVLYCPNLPGWENVPLRDELESALGGEVLIDDGVRCLALAEKRYGHGRDLETFLFLYIGRGVGAGIILNNRFFRGSNGLSGEFGHITVRDNGPLCSCGNNGCLEALVSRTAILRSAQEMISANVYSTLREKLSRREPLTLEDIEHAAEAGDKLANMLIHGLGENIGTGVADLVNIFDPGIVVLGGEVVDRFGDHLVEGIVRTVRLRGIHSITQRTGILTSKLESAAAARGAATLMIERFVGSEILSF